MSTLHSSHGNISDLTLIPGKIIETAKQIFGLQNSNEQTSRAITPVTTKPAPEDNKMLAALKSHPEGVQNSVQKVADVQGDVNYI
ncbi:hypothetical protein RR48_09317 [Papilio machaon]|uniref:Uncharacterized protein n=1 Tax=Papilio machaon TaxID=76193 RepID=A0A194RDD3_PAPMA|nr:hypothetical protein RR48_09317 [Papilio machaon]